MTWQQIVILTLLILGTAATVFKTGRNRELSSGTAAFAVLITIGYNVGFALILHSGGFW